MVENGHGEPIWSDFTGTGTNKEDFINGDNKTTNMLDLDYAWKTEITYDKQCVQMDPKNNYLLEPVDCSLESKYICMKTTCPDGFQWYDMNSCVSAIDSTSSKKDASASCKNLHPKAKLLSPKTAFDQMIFQEYLKSNSFTHEVFLGAEMNENGHWFWDADNPIFVAGKLFYNRFKN